MNKCIQTANYTYDAYGNLASYPYKGITPILYNVLNRTDKIIFTSSANQYINYTYDASGTLIRKQQYNNVGGVATLQNTTDYLDGFVYTTVTGTQTLSYFPMREGRVLYSGTTFTQEFIITDQQGNARVSFQDNGSGVAVVKQENSYYGFGMALANSPVTLPTVPNKQLYNGGSEWQNDYTNLPDYYQTFNRNYDAALGRFVGVDPKAESAESMTSYQYAGNNPIMYNDPLGDAMKQVDMPVGYGPSGSSSFSGEFAQLQLENSAYQFVYGGGGFNPADIGRSSDPIGSAVYDRATGTGSLSGAIALINSVSGGKVGSVQSLMSNILDYVLPGNYSGTMLKQVNIFGNQGGDIRLLEGGVKNGILDADFFVSGVRANGLQMIQIASYTIGGIKYKRIDGGHNGKPYYYSKGEKINGLKVFSIWDGTSGDIITHDSPDGVGATNEIDFQTMIVAVNYNNTGVDKILGAFNWVWTRSANASITLTPTASPAAISFVHQAYPWYQFK